MYEAIVTKYLGPTNTRSGRVKATVLNGKSVTVSWDHALSVPQNHAEAARTLALKLGWEGTYLQGGYGPNGYVFILSGYEGFKL